MKRWLLLICLLTAARLLPAQENTGFQLKDQKDGKGVDVFWNGRLLTAYTIFDSIRKPILYPLRTPDGITVTRGYPIEPRAGERTDHPHHAGLWMNYESVNGLDFWNNSTAIAPEKRGHYGTILHDRIVSKKGGRRSASLEATARWIRPDGKVLMNERTTYHFSVKGAHFLIDRTTTLTATDSPVVFKDVKDGFLAIRVARELEMPTQQADIFVDALGNQTTVPKVNNEGVTGLYYGSTGLKGDSVWSSKGPWTMLTGKKDGKDITIALFDHPSNTGYPAYWHARGYGLFALNPLGRKVFSNGQEELNFSLQPGASVTFRYRILIASEKLTPAAAQRISQDFASIAGNR